MDEQHTATKRTWIIVSAIVGVLVIALGAYLFFTRNSPSSPIRSVTSLFGQLGQEIARPLGGDIQPGGSFSGGNGPEGAAEEPLFRQLSTIPTAGATVVERDGKTFVRYIAKENGYTYEVDPKTGQSVQLTNTTIPRLYEAYWGNAGESVTLRYLTRDALEQDTIKTYLAYLSVPKKIDLSATATTPILGTLIGDFLPDNISSVSVSPDGTKLFYLLPINNEVAGTILTLATRAKKEIFRNTFKEWTPQLLNNETVILTTKPSAKVEGFSYLFDPKDRSFSRIVRKVNALTTLANTENTRVLYSENKIGKLSLNVYDKKGYAGDEGLVFQTMPLPIATLPEKCVWSQNRVRIFCAAFSATPKAELPDEWYQGTLAFADLFWTVNTDSSEIAFLADPTKEESAQNQSFDVMNPFMNKGETYFFFINKNDMTLWSMRIEKEKYMTVEEEEAVLDTTTLTPDELKDAVGSMPTTTVKK